MFGLIRKLGAVAKRAILFSIRLSFWVLPRRLLKQVFYAAMERLEEKEGVFITFHIRPKYSSGYGLCSDTLKRNKSFAVVIQGPVIKDYDFTLETIRIYKKIFNDSIIILSTWDDEDAAYIALIKEEGIRVLLNKKPENPGILNVNYQIKSSYAGIQDAKALGAEYVLKTRSDQRIYEVNLRESLCNLADYFPVVKGYKQNKRLISMRMATFKYRPSGPTDMLLFGDIHDMLLFWGAELDARNISPKEFKSRYRTLKTPREEIELNYPEVYLFNQFLKKIGRDLSCSIENYWKILAGHFCIIDTDIYWFKYLRHIEYKWLSYKSLGYHSPLSFKEWLNLYMGLENKLVIPEEVLNSELSGAIKKI